VKKKLFIALLFSSMLIGCSKKDNIPDDMVTNQINSTKDNQTAIKDAATEDETVIENLEQTEQENTKDILPLKPDTNYVTEAMVERANVGEGNLSRLAAVMRKAENGEEITFGVIGGSITQGSSTSKPENSYAYRTYEWWVQAFPNTKVNYINAGIGATNSYLGVHRVDKDLLSQKPDVVVVEFSVNDSANDFFKETYEDLVRKILSADNNPAVILLFTTMEDGTSAQAQHLHVGFKYEIPRISYRDAILQEIKDGAFTWKDISPDNIHPNDKGHAIIGELMWNFLNSVRESLDTIQGEVKSLDIEPIFREAYKEATILDSETLEPIQLGSFEKSSVYDRFKNNWTTNTGEESIIFKTDAMNIGIMYYKTTDGKSGQYDVYVDGEYKATLDANFTGGWGNYTETVEIYRSKEKQSHTIEIKKSENSTGDEFSILGLLIS
jgi:lysophospholipase L1-like esterase